MIKIMNLHTYANNEFAINKQIITISYLLADVGSDASEKGEVLKINYQN